MILAISIIVVQAILLFIQTMRVAYYKGYFDQKQKNRRYKVGLEG